MKGLTLPIPLSFGPTSKHVGCTSGAHRLPLLMQLSNRPLLGISKKSLARRLVVPAAKGSEDAARKALQDALKGTKDPFVDIDKRRLKKRGDGGGGDGGGGGGGSGGFNFSEWGDRFRGTLSGFFKFVAALFILSLVGALLLLGDNVFDIIKLIAGKIFRLEGNPNVVLDVDTNMPMADVRGQLGGLLGPMEEYVIDKYGPTGEITDLVSESEFESDED